MCRKTKDGYRLNSGRIIKYDDLDFSLLTPEEFRELSEEKASFIELITIKQDVSKILDGISDIKKSYADIKKKYDECGSDCPVDEEYIGNIVDKKIINFKHGVGLDGESPDVLNKKIEDIYWENLKHKIVSGSNLLKAAFIFFTALIFIGMITGLIDSIETIVKMVNK
jgi:hypothetical protein